MKVSAKGALNPRKLSAEHGISHVTFEAAIVAEKARLEGWVDGAATSAGAEMLYGPLTRPAPPKPPTKVHPVAELFPMMVGDEFDALVADIGENGLNTPMTVMGDTMLDGRNRRAACAQAGVVPRFIEYEGSDPVAFIISQNVKRRQMTVEQRAAVAAELANMRVGGKEANSANLLNCNVSQRKAADLLGVSARSVQAAVKVRAEAVPEVFEAIKAGKIAVSRAAEMIALDEDDQRQLVSLPVTDIIHNHERIKKEIKREETFERINKQAATSPAWPEGRYSVIYADPPTEDDFGHTKKDVELHYPTMSWDDLKALPVEEIATEDAVLYLWSAPHVIHKMLEVMARWGFEYRTHIVWVKDKIGLGQWCRNQHEVLLIGRRGDFPPPPEAVRTSSAITGPPVGEHSEKPEIVSEMIERWYPTASKVELFRRGGARPGWAVYGFEALVDAL